MPGGRDSCRAACRRLDGFTLIEVLIAVVVLSVGIVLVLQGMHGALAAWDGGVERMRSAMLAGETLEQWRLGARETGELPSSSERGRFDPPFADYRWQVESKTVAVPGAAPESGALHELLCTVWREGHERTFSVATRIYLPEPPGMPEGQP
jgi:prepilin-type N-terminal cleavage/methylation domain-containing protein